MRMMKLTMRKLNRKDELKTKVSVDSSIFFKLALARVTFLGSREKLLLLDLFEDRERIFSLTIPDLERIIGRNLRIAKFDGKACLLRAESDVAFLANGAVKAVSIADPRYPAQLAQIHDPPFVLFYRGELPGFDVPCVGVVGTRNPTGNARSAAFRFAMELSGMGLSVVSGLARGIDHEAHSGSLEGKGKAIAVLGNGIDSFYPKSSEDLGRRIIENFGVVFSEYPPGTPPLRYNFPARNRIISGLSRSVVIIQAPVRSGALITADYALEQGRDLYVHKAGLGGSAGEGSLKLVREGAPVLASASDLVLQWGGAAIGRSAPSGKKRLHGEAIGAGNRLARLMEKELKEELVLHNGDINVKGVL
jgi:DNA processing protein